MDVQMDRILDGWTGGQRMVSGSTREETDA